MASVQVDTIGKEATKSGYGYKYQNTLPVSMLGLVDDIIGVTNAGHEAQQMNALINIKTAEKRLQFGVKKCKSMLVCKDSENVLNSHLKIDKWSVTHEDDPDTGGSVLQETYTGMIDIEKTVNQKYLGFMISSKGDNMVNIKMMKTKSVWVIRKIFNKLNSLHLQQYYFECGMIFLNVMLRTSILYASETYYNLKETELRQLERIEEGYLRQLFKTSAGCPISQLYLEAGHTPARFEILKSRLLFLKTILNENPDSQIYKVLQLQFQNPIKGDWASTCLQDIKDLEMDITLEEIKTVSLFKFKRLLKKHIEQKSLKYLKGKQGSKGIDIRYPTLKMAEYLMPNSECSSIEQQRYIFGIRNRMISLPVNFPQNKMEIKCVCGQREDMQHVYQCKYWNTEQETTEYEMIYRDNVKQQVNVYNRFRSNYENRKTYLDENENMKQKRNISPHGISLIDPLYTVYSNGN